MHINHFRFGTDDGNEATHGWLANEDTSLTEYALLDDVILIRFNEQETGGTQQLNLDAQLEAKLNDGAWFSVTISTSVVAADITPCFVNNANCTQRLSGTGTFETTGGGCSEDGTSGGSVNDPVANGCSETEFAIMVKSADVVNGDVVYFRLTSPDTTFTMDVAPQIAMPAAAGGGGTLTAEQVASEIHLDWTMPGD
jgi:hypothetical protein